MPANDDFKNASLEDLQKMQNELAQFIERRLTAKRQQALSEIRRLTKEFDLSYEEVVAVVRTTTRRGKAPALYRNPENSRQTWAGKGDAPDWFTKHPDPEKLKIPGS